MCNSVLSVPTEYIEPTEPNTSDPDYKDGFDCLADPGFDEENIFNNLNNLDGYFTKNNGQIENESVKYYIQGGGVWFLNYGVVFEFREEVKSREFRIESRPNYLIRGIDLKNLSLLSFVVLYYA